ncbi:germin-like protein 2-4 [Phalaenopsis equestris]|uniref:germin-like protein 2-4 n=1 Tax=Phalaenopsis equestris TaxID=78828 RepID=UPI0009E447A7|nr:germin-like protein 2-4 [Phalaenopsis equestris]
MTIYIPAPHTTSKSHISQQNMVGNLIFFLPLLLLLLLHSTSSDPDPIQDFCIPDPGPSPILLSHLSTYPCKNPSNTTSDDFVFSGARSPSKTSPGTGFAGLSVTPSLFPALNTLGVSFARADLEPGGVNPPHYHPRATETALVVEGKIYSGFVDSGGRLFAKVIAKGEVMVFPKAMVHFQMNVGDSPAVIFGSFNGENPGVVRVPATIFGSGIKEVLLEKAFGLSRKEIEGLERRFGHKEVEL